MYDTAKRVALVKARARELRRGREKRLLGGLFVLCAALFGSLVGVISAATGTASGAVQGMYGATMMLENAGGYVLVGVGAFSAAVVITVLCIRGQEKTKAERLEGEEDKTKA